LIVSAAEGVSSVGKDGANEMQILGSAKLLLLISMLLNNLKY
jgi:hypothetical protein